MTVKPTLPTVWPLVQATLLFCAHHWRHIVRAVGWPLGLTILVYVITPNYLSLTLGVTLGLLISLRGLLWLIYLLLSNAPTGNHQQVASLGRHFLPLLGLVVLSQIIILGGLALLIVPGVVAAIYLIFSMFILLEKKNGYWQVMATSWEYVRHFWWAVFGRWLVLVASGAAALLLVRLPFISLTDNWAGWSRVAGVVGLILTWLLLVPLALTYLFQIYLALKRLKPELEVIPIDSHRRRLWFTILLVVGLAALLFIAYHPGSVLSR